MSNETGKMPVLFVGHGSPMNAIEDNEFTRIWAKIATLFPKPKAILAVSAHWYTNGTRIDDEENPKMIYDMYGFPEELYKVVYDADGAPEFAKMTKDLIKREVTIDRSWGLDHGTWSVLTKMYPDADIPTYQLSVDGKASAETHFKIGQEISALREEGVLILGSGNVVHNLSKINWGMKGGFPWADEFDIFVKEKIQSKNYEDVVNYKKIGNIADLAVRTPDHFFPLLYVLGAAREEDEVTVFNEKRLMGSMSMTCYLFK